MPPTVGKGMTRAVILWGSCLHWQDPLLIFSSICAGHHEMTWIASSGLHDLCKVIRVFIKGSKTSWASPLSAKASGLSLGSSASSAGLLQEFNKVVISMTSRPCWHQWQFHQQQRNMTEMPKISKNPTWLFFIQLWGKILPTYFSILLQWRGLAFL